MPDDERMRLPRRRQERSVSDRERRMATADQYARHLTETGSRCEANTGTDRFCHWRATELPGDEVGVRCTIHGGRYLDSTARLDPNG